MGKLLDWDNMPPIGTKVVFKGYRNGRHKHWGFEVGKTYIVGKDRDGDIGPLTSRGLAPQKNHNDDFIFELATPFTINEGDYIDSREFSREECERFCELAVECGYGRGEWLDFYGNGVLNLGVTSTSRRLFWSDFCGSWFISNITTQFREFLDKEKGVKKFTKVDLKDGMRVELDTTNLVFYVCGNKLAVPFPLGHHWGEIGTLDDNLQSVKTGAKVIRVTDRDGTVLFEREEELREISLDEIAKAFNLPVERVRIKK